MTLAELKKRPPAVKQVEWRGGPVWLRKLSAKDHLELFGRIKQEAAKETDYDADRLATVEFHIDTAIRSLCNEAGVLLKDSEDVRSFLIEGVAFDELIALGKLVLSHSGYDTDEKKTNSVGTKDSPTSSA